MSSGIPPGWYEDPSQPAQLRYWDGNAWTGSTAPKQAAPAPGYGPPTQGYGRPAPPGYGPPAPRPGAGGGSGLAGVLITAICGVVGGGLALGALFLEGLTQDSVDIGVTIWETGDGIFDDLRYW